MKEYLRFSSVFFIFSILLCVCVFARTETVDEKFLKQIENSLEERWDLLDKFDSETNKSESEIREAKTSFVDSEIKRLKQFKNEEFSNSDLKALALQYIELIYDQKDSLVYFNSDREKYSKLWGSAYNERSVIIAKLVNDYGLKFPEKYKDHLNSLIENSKNVTVK